MTDIQLAILLEGIAGDWHRAIENAESMLDSTVARTRTTRHMPWVVTLLETPITPACMIGACGIDSHYETVDDPSPITAPLWAALESLQAQISALYGPNPDK